MLNEEFVFLVDLSLFIMTDEPDRRPYWGELTERQRRILLAFRNWCLLHGIIAWKRDPELTWERQVGAFLHLPAELVQIDGYRAIELVLRRQESRTATRIARIIRERRQAAEAHLQERVSQLRATVDRLSHELASLNHRCPIHPNGQAHPTSKLFDEDPPPFPEQVLGFLDDLTIFLETERQTAQNLTAAPTSDADCEAAFDRETLAMELLDRLSVVTFLKDSPDLLKRDFEGWWQWLRHTPI